MFFEEKGYVVEGQLSWRTENDITVGNELDQENEDTLKRFVSISTKINGLFSNQDSEGTVKPMNFIQPKMHVPSHWIFLDLQIMDKLNY